VAIPKPLVWAILPLALAGCIFNRTSQPAGSSSPSTSARGFPLGDLRIDGARGVSLVLEVEIADTPTAQATGLMNVKQLTDNAGMAFIFDRETGLAFWMKDTVIPLDTAFWTRQGQIIDIHQMEPCHADPCPTYAPNQQYLGAVEVNRGLLAAHGIAVTDRVTLTRRSDRMRLVPVPGPS
jgi:uncharacterized membrane protein (UPF0127 family)